MRFSPLFSGSSGNCSYIEAGPVRLLVDAGLPCRTITAALADIGVAASSLTAILVTHEHTDHTKGIGALSRRYGIPVYANRDTWEGMSRTVEPLGEASRREFETGMDFYIGCVNVLPFAIPHDARDPVGYSFVHDGIKLTVMTDIGHMSRRLLDRAAGSRLLLIEANHDVDMLMAGSYPYPLKRRILGECGHLSNESCGRALATLYNRGVNCAILGHLSEENNMEELCLATVRSVLREEQIPDDAFALALAHRDRPGGIFEVD